jgi:hypothetical protein
VIHRAPKRIGKKETKNKKGDETVKPDSGRPIIWGVGWGAFNEAAPICAKVVSNRLKLVLPEIISEEQSVFVPGRLIIDNIVSAYECLHFMKRSKSKNNSYCALKLDVMKTYDRVEWSYLGAIMEKLGFARPWVNIVMHLVSSVSFSVMFNGSESEEFKPTRGIQPLHTFSC